MQDEEKALDEGTEVGDAGTEAQRPQWVEQEFDRSVYMHVLASRQKFDRPVHLIFILKHRNALGFHLKFLNFFDYAILSSVYLKSF